MSIHRQGTWTPGYREPVLRRVLVHRDSEALSELNQVVLLAWSVEEATADCWPVSQGLVAGNDTAALCALSDHALYPSSLKVHEVTRPEDARRAARGADVELAVAVDGLVAHAGHPLVAPGVIMRP